MKKKRKKEIAKRDKRVESATRQKEITSTDSYISVTPVYRFLFVYNIYRVYTHASRSLCVVVCVWVAFCSAEKKTNTNTYSVYRVKCVAHDS